MAPRSAQTDIYCAQMNTYCTQIGACNHLVAFCTSMGHICTWTVIYGTRMGMTGAQMDIYDLIYMIKYTTKDHFVWPLAPSVSDFR